VKIITKPTDKKSLFLEFLFIGAVSYIMVIASIFPFKWFEDFTGGPICVFRKIAGMNCFFCGTTRSLLSSFRFDFKEAFFHNPTGIFIFTAFIFIFINASLGISVRKRISIHLSKREKIILWIGVVIVLSVNWGFKLVSGL